MIEENKPMVKSDLIMAVAAQNPTWSYRDVEAAVNSIFNSISDKLADGGRAEIRGFGSFSIHEIEGRENARNPKTGETVKTPNTRRAHFKPGKMLRTRVDNGLKKKSISRKDSKVTELEAQEA